jgi:hypothetical protein
LPPWNALKVMIIKIKMEMDKLSIKPIDAEYNKLALCIKH